MIELSEEKWKKAVPEIVEELRKSNELKKIEVEALINKKLEGLELSEAKMNSLMKEIKEKSGKK